MIRNKILFMAMLVSFLMIHSPDFAQEDKVEPYQVSAGLRLGFSSGISGKYFLNENIALEGIVGARYFNGFISTVLLEYHLMDVLNVEGLYPYFGGGIHAGYYFWYDDWNNGRGWGSNKKRPTSAVFVGIDLIGGVEYDLRVHDLPLTISLDFMPHYDFLGFVPAYLDGGIAVRYIFK